MADLKFIHCSDLHLGAPFKSLSFYDPMLADRMMNASFDALERIVDKALAEKADFILFSGDIFDSENTTPNSRYRFAEAIKRAGIRCYVAYGNHDHRRRWEDTIPLPPNASVFPDHPENIPYTDENGGTVDVIGVSHSVKEEGRDLTAGINGTSAFSIAVVHCDLDTSSEGKRYAPCKLSDLLSKDIDYWALGHIHKREVVHRDPYVVYPGSTQGRNIKETGEKGAYLVTVRDGKVVSAEFFVTGPILWAEEEVNITGMDLSSLLEGMRIRNGSFVRLRITGQGALDRMIRFEQRDFIRAVESYRKCRVVGIEVRSIPDIDINERRRTGDFTSAVINEADRMFDMSKEEIISAICMTKASQSPDIRRVFERMSETELREMVNDARASLLERLLGGSI